VLRWSDEAVVSDVVETQVEVLQTGVVLERMRQRLCASRLQQSTTQSQTADSAPVLSPGKLPGAPEK